MYKAAKPAVVAGVVLAHQLRPAHTPAAARITPPSGRIPVSLAVTHPPMSPKVTVVAVETSCGFLMSIIPMRTSLGPCPKRWLDFAA